MLRREPRMRDPPAALPVGREAAEAVEEEMAVEESREPSAPDVVADAIKASRLGGF